MSDTQEVTQEVQPQPITCFGAGIALGVPGGRFANQVVSIDPTTQKVVAQSLGVPLSVEEKEEEETEPVENTEEATQPSPTPPAAPITYSNSG